MKTREKKMVKPAAKYTVLLIIAAVIIIAAIAISGAMNGPLIGGQKDAHGCLIAAGYSWCEEKAKCIRAWEENCTASGSNAGIANPASVFCVQSGGAFKAVTTAGGETGYCDLGNGVLCEEWAFFRSNGTTCTPPA